MSKFIDRTGETRTMNNGLRATIVNYRNSLDIDVQFENGEMALSRVYASFVKGHIKCPLLIKKVDEYLRISNVNINPSISFLADIDELYLAREAFWSLDANGYVFSRTLGYFHRLAMGANEKEFVDHINGNRFDNRKNNLRLCNHANNLQNQKINVNNLSGYKGVWKDKRSNKWRAFIGANCQKIHLGSFNTPEDAARAYNEAALKYHGEFSKLNEI